jgi:hypothetical protein
MKQERKGILKKKQTKYIWLNRIYLRYSTLSSKSTGKEFEEKVVLLTERALYVCSYNYGLEKVIQFKRLALETIISLQIGEYILSSLTPTSRSAEQNYGIIVRHLTDGELVRWNTGSIQNKRLDDISIGGREDDDEQGNSDSNTDDDDLGEDGIKAAVKLAMEGIDTITFKAVRYNILGELDGEVENCQQQILEIVRAIAKATGHTEDDAEFIIHKPIISLEQAEKTDGIFKKMGHKIKQAIWI